MPQVITEGYREVTVHVLDVLVADVDGRIYAATAGPGLYRCDCTSQQWTAHGYDLSKVCEHLRAALASMGKDA